MILGIGSDLIPISRIEGTLRAHDARFIARCFADSERDYVENRASGVAAEQAEKLRAAGYAKRWAAKEACAKALGLGIRNDIYLRDIIIGNDSAGKPSILLAGGAQQRLAELTPAGAMAKIDLSLSDDGGMALAFVVISTASISH